MSFIEDLKKEYARAVNKFPKGFDLIPALMEECGELAQALLDQKYKSTPQACSENVYEEAVQVAAVAMRIAQDGCPEFPDYDPNPIITVKLDGSKQQGSCDCINCRGGE